jgi:23S rRNA pseudouridine2605 synthase
MARRHEDRKPGQRFARTGSAPAKKAPVKKDPAKKDPAMKAVGRKAPSARSGPARESDANRPAGKRPASATPLRKAPVKRAPLRGSKRLAEGLVVTPSKVLGGDSSTLKDGKVRLNHFLAQSGLCSRRNADDLIASGRVQVNGEIVRELGVRVDPVDDDVRYDGTRLQPERPVYVLVNKPKGVVCTNATHEQKKRVVDLLPTIRGRIFTVGRLDLDSEGLLLVTNDGAFAQEMTHPRYGISKLYSVMVRGRIQDSELTKARGGVWLAEGPTGGMELKVDRFTKEKTYLKVTLREGKNREIRRVFAKLGYPVISLKRVRIGHLSLHGLSDGAWRFLQPDEVTKLRELAHEEKAAGGAAAPVNAFATETTLSRSPSQRSPSPRAPSSRATSSRATGSRTAGSGGSRSGGGSRPSTSRPSSASKSGAGARKKASKTSKR